MPANDEQSKTAKRDNAANAHSAVASESTPSTDNSNKPKKRWYRRIPAWKILEGTGIAAVIFYAYVTYYEWRDLRHNFEVEQRSWVRMKYAILGIPDENTPMNGWPLTVNNGGKSPALQTQVKAVLEILPKGNRPSFDFSKYFGADVSILFPGDEDTIPIGFSDTEATKTPRQLSKAEVQNLSSGNAYLAMFAQATYRDQFGTHWTRFCVWKAFVPPFEFMDFNSHTCVLWNGVGDGVPPLLDNDLQAQ